MSDDYGEFLATKRRAVPDAGKDVGLDAVHESLFGFQREIVGWACRKGRAAVFADTGLGKTRMQLEWARLMGGRALILAPLAVCRQTIREGAAIDIDVAYVEDGVIDGPGVYITNYERADRIDPAMLTSVVLDESSILKNVDGKTRRLLTDLFAPVPYRLACTATPAPNDIAELTNHAEWLGAASRVEMLSAYFVHDDEGWRMKGHAADAMWAWVSTWAVAVRSPADLGYPDDDYVLPGLEICSHLLNVDIEAEGQLFPTELGGVGGRAAVRRATLDARVARAVELIEAEPDEPWIVWCGLNDEAEAVTRGVEKAVNITGSSSPESKAEAVYDFVDGASRVIVTKPSILGFGLNFQHCARMVFVGLSDSYESYYQCIRRCYRFGQTRPVVAHIVLSDLEGQIADNVSRKERQAHRAVEALVGHTRTTFAKEPV